MKFVGCHAGKARKRKVPNPTMIPPVSADERDQTRLPTVNLFFDSLEGTAVHLASSMSDYVREVGLIGGSRPTPAVRVGKANRKESPYTASRL